MAQGPKGGIQRSSRPEVSLNSFLHLSHCGLQGRVQGGAQRGGGRYRIGPLG